MNNHVNFYVVAISENTNSFGLRQMIMVSKEGITCKGCFNNLNVRQKGEKITGLVNMLHGNVINVQIPGAELIEVSPERAPKDVLKVIFS